MLVLVAGPPGLGGRFGYLVCSIDFIDCRVSGIWVLFWGVGFSVIRVGFWSTELGSFGLLAHEGFWAMVGRVADRRDGRLLGSGR